jgi:CHASE3 domain sensor protein
MRWFRNLRVFYKILAGFVVVLTVLAASVAFVWIQAARIEQLNEQFRDADDLLTAIEDLRLAL